MTTPSPRNALSPRVMLATAMHSQPGVYALLLGSGVSTGAGVPTGWGVVSNLVEKVAAAQDPDDVASHELAVEDPEAWWAANGTVDLGYSSLLAAMAPTPAARQGLLQEYFVPTDDEREQNIKVPSPAHHAIAQLVKRGIVKVILTTNFDRLMEQVASPRFRVHPVLESGWCDPDSIDAAGHRGVGTPADGSVLGWRAVTQSRVA
ncbi:hypothetical protein OOK62_29025, partial [Mycolicibacterium sp. J2]|nr:hypothetical protein [Mycolicibacterium sp. J2]